MNKNQNKTEEKQKTVEGCETISTWTLSTSPGEPCVGIGVNKELHVEHVAQLGEVEDEDAL